MKLQNFNKEWAQGKSEEEFVQQHLHLGSEKDLKKIYRDLVPKKKTENPILSQPPSEN